MVQGVGPEFKPQYCKKKKKKIHPPIKTTYLLPQNIVMLSGLCDFAHAVLFSPYDSFLLLKTLLLPLRSMRSLP
jgi:hypothetical protein